MVVLKEKYTMKTVISKDGTAIAYDQLGQGPILILVSQALSDRTETSRLAELLAGSFTVVNYDRRGRGDSEDTPPYAVEREVEDIEALIDEAGGSAFLFGSSSGATLSLEAASRLNGKVKKLFLYEPPLIVDESRPPLPEDFVRQVAELLAADRRGDALKLFLTKAMGIPALFVTLMRFMPDWSKMKALAHTLPYDLMITAGSLTGRPLPPGQWSSAGMPTLVVTGEKSEGFFHSGAQALAGNLPKARHHVLEGQSHGAVVMGTKALAPVMVEFFQSKNGV